MSINPADFDYVRKLICEKSGIVLDDGKEYLVEARLSPIVHQEGFSSLQELISQLRTNLHNGLWPKIVDAITTNETLFFRDSHPFDALKNFIIPELVEKRSSERRLDLWCAASSSGQEPYSITMLLSEHFPNLNNWNLRFIASDISQEMLAYARKGEYSQLEVNRGLPAALLVKYFQRVGSKWQISEQIRRQIQFSRINLTCQWPPLPAMDVIFMRNVLIYFDGGIKGRILDKVCQLLKPKGYLFLGGAETALNLHESFERVQFDKTICYRLRH